MSSLTLERDLLKLMQKERAISRRRVKNLTAAIADSKKRIKKMQKKGKQK